MLYKGREIAHWQHEIKIILNKCIQKRMRREKKICHVNQIHFFFFLNWNKIKHIQNLIYCMYPPSNHEIEKHDKWNYRLFVFLFSNILYIIPFFSDRPTWTFTRTKRKTKVEKRKMKRRIKNGIKKTVVNSNTKR